MSDIFFGFGNRKESIAKVHLTSGNGQIRLFTGNLKERRERSVKEYFCNDFLIEDFLSPLKLIGKRDSFDVNIFVKGGGISAQADSIKLGIARALLAMDGNLKSLLKTEKFLKQDRRFKERKKIGRRGARRAPQFTKR